MLLYDWTRDPLFYDDLAGQKKLIDEQKRALIRYFKKGENLKTILKDFVWSSGLLEKIAQTFMLDKADFELLAD